eukprot:12809740-Heterocapsa_arctica.AAC.1
MALAMGIRTPRANIRSRRHQELLQLLCTKNTKRLMRGTPSWKIRTLNTVRPTTRKPLTSLNMHSKITKAPRGKKKP